MKKSNYQSPVKAMSRYKNRREIRIAFRAHLSAPETARVHMTFQHALELLSHLRDMLEGDLIAIETAPCGCAKKKFAHAQRNQ